MRTWLALGLLAVAAVGCVLDVGLPDAPTPVFHADCGAKPSVLAHVAGLDARSMAFDLFNLYVIASEAGDATKQEIWRIPLRDGPPTRLATDLSPVAGFALSGAFVVVTTNPAVSDAGATGELLAIPNGAGGAPIRLAANRPAPGVVIAGDDVVYWTEQGLDPSGQPSGAIMTMNRSGDGGVTTLQRMDAGDVPRQFGSLDWVLADGGSAEWLYWTTADPGHPVPAQGEVHGCALPTPLSPVVRVDDPDGGGTGSIQLMGDDTILYTGPRGITLVTVAKDGSVATGDFIPTGGFVGRIGRIADIPYGPVYFVDPSSGALTAQVTHDASPATARRLATGVDPATALKVDDACVYWIDARAGNVMMVQH